MGACASIMYTRCVPNLAHVPILAQPHYKNTFLLLFSSTTAPITIILEEPCLQWQDTSYPRVWRELKSYSWIFQREYITLGTALPKRGQRGPNPSCIGANEFILTANEWLLRYFESAIVLSAWSGHDCSAHVPALLQISAILTISAVFLYGTCTYLMLL